MTEPIHHDFKLLLAQIIEAGITVHTIAKMMHRQHVQVQRWLKGSEPRHYEGEMILAIHRHYVSHETLHP